MTARGTHPASVQVLGYEQVTGIDHPVPVYAKTCAVCGRPVRRMTGLGGIFQHAGSGRPKGPHTPAQKAAISEGMRQANARREARRAANR